MDDGRPDVVDELEPGPADVEPGGSVEQDRLHAIVQGDRGLHVQHDGAVHASRVGRGSPAPSKNRRAARPPSTSKHDPFRGIVVSPTSWRSEAVHRIRRSKLQPSLAAIPAPQQ